VSGGGITLKANVAVRNQPAGVGQREFAWQSGNRWHSLPLLNLNIIGGSGALLEPTVWANAAYPGPSVNTINDAARHAYWTCLMMRYTTAEYARGLGIAHEVTSSIVS